MFRKCLFSTYSPYYMVVFWKWRKLLLFILSLLNYCTLSLLNYCTLSLLNYCTLWKWRTLLLYVLSLLNYCTLCTFTWFQLSDCIILMIYIVWIDIFNQIECKITYIINIVLVYVIHCFIGPIIFHWYVYNFVDSSLCWEHAWYICIAWVHVHDIYDIYMCNSK